MKRGGLSLALALALPWTAFVSAPARADLHTYAIVIGNNRAPQGATEALAELQFADDDAADFATLARELGGEIALLTVLDHDSQQRFAALTREARPPTLVELRRSVARVRTQIEADAARGDEAVVLIFFSGHGVREPGRPAALALLDGALTQEVLYEEVLAALPARFIHLLVDACHAEAVVRPRDVTADVVELRAEDISALAARNNLERFPHVGAIVAAESAAQAHEWDGYRRGVFTHETLSGLRGAADVNGDRRIEYSELSAFLTAANREVTHPGARPSIVVRVPALDRRTPIVDLSRAVGAGRLVGGSGTPKFNVEDALGNRLADVFSEPDHALELTLPAHVNLFLRTEDREASFQLRPERPLPIGELALRKTATRARGALESSLRAGLFGAPFGPVYYRGFVDAHPEFVPVPQARTATSDPQARRDPRDRARFRRAGWWVTSLGLASALAAGISLGVALDARREFEGTELEREATQAAERYTSARNAAIGLSATAIVTIGVGVWLLVRGRHAEP